MAAFISASESGEPMFRHTSKHGVVLVFSCELTDAFFAEFYLKQLLDQPQMTILFNEVAAKAASHGYYTFDQSKSFVDVAGVRTAFDLSLVRW